MFCGQMSLGSPGGSMSGCPSPVQEKYRHAAPRRPGNEPFIRSRCDGEGVQLRAAGWYLPSTGRGHPGSCGYLLMATVKGGGGLSSQNVIGNLLRVHNILPKDLVA
ncbi:hypothetical protein CRENBAI_009158 [Crenichthys baileyi]|uniref:Uncharacterized protein n=1 Tax=Crenichthys baileyi TaxID=28760 RepID=A0AAV9SKV6_9TELE